MRRTACIALCAAFAVVAANGVSVPAGAGAVAQPQRLKPLRLRETCVTRAERRHVIRFTASDRVRLIGVVLGRGPRAVILAHQGASDLCIWVPYARTLAARGYRVLIFDHRGWGSSGRSTRPSRRDRVDYDVLGAIRALRSRGATSVVLGGASLGAAAVLSAAARATPPVNGVISLSSPSRYQRIDVLNAVRMLQVPALFVATVEDQPFADDARQLYDACATPEKQLRILPGFDHGVFMLRDPNAQTAVDAFIAGHSA
jgi:alpha-beta hydrolase superfamily lysophospholipase